MITAASSDFICNSISYNYCYSNVQTCENYWPLFSNLTMVLETNEYTIQPEGYTLNNDLDNHACSIAVTSIPDSQGIVILGDTWLRNFVSTYDYKAEAAEALGDGVTLDVSVVVLACPDVTALPLQGRGDHIDVFQGIRFDDDLRDLASHDQEFLRRATQVKNIWIPYGE